MSARRESEAYAAVIYKLERRIVALELLGRKLTEVIEDFMPNIGKCVLQDYGRLNEALIDSTKLLGKWKKEKK